MKNVALCLPYTKYLPAEAVIGLINLIMHKSELYRVSNIVFGSDCRVDRNRCTIASKALEGNPDYLFWMDDDTIIEPNTIDKLLRAKKEMVSAAVFYRTAPHAPHSFYWDPMKCDGEGGFIVRHFIPHLDLFRVDGVGFSCVLIASWIFHEVEQPYFKFIDNPKNPMGEDLYFCKSLRDNGIEIWVDPTVRPKHISTDGIGFKEYKNEVTICQPMELLTLKTGRTIKQSLEQNTSKVKSTT